MHDSVASVLANQSQFACVEADAEAFLASLPVGSVDLIVGSPPYTSARSYLENGVDLGIARGAEEWSAWMVGVTKAALRACKGLVAWVVEGQTNDYSWDAAPLLLGADLVRAGVTLRRCCYYRRVGIPGSGGPDWFRCDAEPVICCTNGGRLPWSDTTACGHPPRWAPGGAMSHRLADGSRVNSDVEEGRKIVGPNGKSRKPPRKHGWANGDIILVDKPYKPPELANPGNVIQETYTAQEVDGLLGAVGTCIDCNVGGGRMGEGDSFSRENEAPYPETLAERFVRSFCPPGGVVLDCFSGSGTTATVALRWGRRFVGCDLRQSQVDLTRRRVATVTPEMFPEGV